MTYALPVIHVACDGLLTLDWPDTDPDRALIADELLARIADRLADPDVAHTGDPAPTGTRPAHVRMIDRDTLARLVLRLNEHEAPRRHDR